jgi:AraC-like DNA-binding protein
MSYNHRQLFARLDSQLAQDLTLSLTTLARGIGVSRHTAGKAFHQLTGMSFSKYRESKLLAKAFRLLNEDPAKSIKIVAIDLGYDSPGGLSRFLRMKTGFTPSAIRNGALQLSDITVPWVQL